MSVIEFAAGRRKANSMKALNIALADAPDLYVKVFEMALSKAGGSMTMDASGRLRFFYPEDQEATAEIDAIRSHARRHGFMPAIKAAAEEARESANMLFKFDLSIGFMNDHA